MRFKKVVLHNHTILEIDVASDRELLDKAEYFAKQKSKYVNTDDPSGRSRSEIELLSQNFLGSLADIVCVEVIQRYIEKHGHQIEVMHYDSVRTDNFINPDLFDIKLVCNHKEYIVEVRSSVCIYISLERMIAEWQVLGPYFSSAKGGFEDDKEFYIRPLYHLSNYMDNRQKRFYSREKGMDFIKNGLLKLYIVGGSTSKLMKAKGRNESGEELKQGRAEFKVINILDALNIADFLQSISDIALTENNINKAGSNEKA